MSEPREERKVVTALFADIVGSTSLAERLDPEDLHEILGGAIARMIAAVESFGGTIKDLAGDGALAIFGAPETHEDDPERAVRAGLRIVRDVRAYAAEVERGFGVAGVDVRVGIESGLVVLGLVGAGGRVEYGATGDALNTASRLQSHAEPGTVLVGPGAREAIADRFDWSATRELELKGKAEPVLVAQAIAVRDRTEPQTTTPIVGRARELARALGFARRSEDGRGAFVFVRGEPGIGKTRLIAELCRRRRDVAWLGGRCVSFGASTPYLPFRDLLRAWLGGDAGDPQVAAARLDAQLGPRSTEVGPYVRLLLGTPLPEDGAVLEGLSPEAVQFRTVRALAELVETIARPGPSGFVIEDLHWADASSVAALEHILPLTRSCPLLVVVSQRPEPDAACEALRVRVAAIPEVASIELDRLERDEERALVRALVGEDVLPEALERRLLETAGGNPFFLQELVRSLIDAGALVRADGGWRFDHEVPVEVPSSVDRVLVARIDRLPGRAKDALSAACVLGRRFPTSLLLEVSQLGDELEPALAELVARDLLLREDGGWAFSHVLIQDAAYRMLLKRRRRELHARVVVALEAGAGPQDRRERLGLLAHHYAAAGQLEPALARHREAAEAALAVSALPEALGHLNAAIAFAGELGASDADPTLLRLLLDRGRTRSRTGDFAGAREDLERANLAATTPSDRAEAASELGFLLAGASDYRQALPLLERALVLSQEAADQRIAATVGARRSIVHTNLLDLARSYGDAAAAVERSRATDDAGSLATALDALELAAVMIGDFGTVEEVALELSKIHGRRGDLWLLQYAIFQSCWGPMASGRWDEAAERLREAEALARRIGDRGPEPMYLATWCWLDRSRGTYRAALDAGRRGIELADEIGHEEWRSWTRAQLGRALLELGVVDEAGTLLREGLEAGERSGAQIAMLRCTSLLALARLRSGAAEAAAELADRASSMWSEVTSPPGRIYLQGADAPIAVTEVRAALGQPGGDGLARTVIDAATAAGWAEMAALGELALGASIGPAEPEAAARAFERALAEAERAGLPGPAWRAHARLARLGVDAGSHAAAARAIVVGLLADLDGATIRTALEGLLRSELESRRGSGWTS